MLTRVKIIVTVSVKLPGQYSFGEKLLNSLIEVNERIKYLSTKRTWPKLLWLYKFGFLGFIEFYWVVHINVSNCFAAPNDRFAATFFFGQGAQYTNGSLVAHKFALNSHAELDTCKQ